MFVEKRLAAERAQREAAEAKAEAEEKAKRDAKLAELNAETEKTAKVD
jgi:hypothetical protein